MAGNGFLCIGKIVGVHGVHGNLKVYSYAESWTIFAPGLQIMLISADGSKKTHVVRHSRPHKRGILLNLEDIESRDLAEQCVGSEIFIEKSVLPALEEGEYYWFDIIGLDVFTEDDSFLGCIESIFPTGSNDVYVVRHPENNKEILIPALKSVIMGIDLEKKEMRVTLPEGLPDV